MKCLECDETGKPPWPYNVVCPRCPDCNGKGKVLKRVEKTNGINRTIKHIKIDIK